MEKIIKSKILDLLEVLNEKRPSNEKVVIGLDGFVDEILHVVATRKNAQEYERLRSMKEYGEKIVQAAGLSTNIEMVRVKEKLGGNGPILSNALASYGVGLTYIGAVGYPHIEKVFEPMAKKCNILPIANPGHTDAIEFDDGKIMVGKHDSLREVNWENIKEIIGIPKLIELINGAKLLGLENWTMLSYMSEIWKGLLNEVLPHIDIANQKKYVFFDLADPEKRTKEDILEAINLIKNFSSYFDVILGLNLKEAIEIAVILGYEEYDINNTNDIDLMKLIKLIADKLEVYSIVVHPTIEAATVIGGSYYHVQGPFTPKPKLTTGAGDNFNAGFCLGQILDLNPEQSLLLGVATSGYYVRNAKSPSFEDVIEFLKLWSEDNV